MAFYSKAIVIYYKNFSYLCYNGLSALGLLIRDRAIYEAILVRINGGYRVYMWKYVSIVRSALAVTFVISALIGCKSDATPEAKEGQKWLTNFYEHTTIRGSWLFFGASAKDNNVVVVVNLTAQQGGDIAAFPDFEKGDFVAKNACPAITEAIWSIIGDGDVIIDARSNGNLIASVSCRTRRLRS